MMTRSADKVDRFRTRKLASVCARLGPSILVILIAFVATQSASSASISSKVPLRPRSQRHTNSRKKQDKKKGKTCKSQRQRKARNYKCERKHSPSRTSGSSTTGRPGVPPNVPSPPVIEPTPTPTQPSCPEPALHTTPEITKGPTEIVGGLYQNGGPPADVAKCENSSPVAGTITVMSLTGEVVTTQKIEDGQFYTIPIAPGSYSMQSSLCAETVDVTVPAESEVLLDLVCQIK